MKPRTKRIVTRVAIVAAVLLALAVAVFLIWALTPLGPDERALAALESNAGITVTETAEGWVFTPAGVTPTQGFVFYPGGHVDARSYAPLLRGVAEKGYYAVLLRVPLSLAVFDLDAAGPAIDAAPTSVKDWVIGGHSLGGVAASTFAFDDARTAGLVLLASYPTESTDLSKYEMPAATIAGTRDEVLDQAAWESSNKYLPKEADVVKLEGGNHAQFGDYGPQPGDGGATISRAEQQRATITKIQQTLEAVR